MLPVTIYHNPNCGTSRNTLALIRNTGIEPEVIHYLLTPPTRAQLMSLIARMEAPVRAVIRTKEKLYEELSLGNPALSDGILIDAMLEHPILMNRPIVVTSLGLRLCRPSELVLEILPLPQRGEFSKEDGEPVINEQGERIVRS